MDGNTTVKYLQTYLEQKDYSFQLLRELPEGADRAGPLAKARQHCFLKLVEEVGEVSRAIFDGKLRQPGDSIKGTLDEELWDVMYYSLCLANLYGIDMEEAIRDKEVLNNQRFHDEHPFEVGR